MGPAHVIPVVHSHKVRGMQYGRSNRVMMRIWFDQAVIVEACAKYCPKAILALIVKPVNSIVPAMEKLYENKGLDPMKILGVTTLDCVRANKFVAEITSKNPSFINVPVVGGHAGSTILPVFSQDKTSKTRRPGRRS